MGLKSPWEFFLWGVEGWCDGVGLWLILLNMGYSTLYEKSMHSGNRKLKK